MYPSSNIVCYLHYPICLTLLACLPLWVPQDLVPCHPWNLRTRWCKWRNLCRLKLKFSHRTKSSCSCPVHRTPVMWSGPVCTYILSLSGSVHNINVERLAFKTLVALHSTWPMLHSTACSTSHANHQWSATLSPLFAAAVFGDGDTNQYHDLVEGFLLWSVYVKCKMNYFWI